MADVLPLGDFSGGLPNGMSPEQLAALMQVLQGKQDAPPPSAGMPGQPTPLQAAPQASAPTQPLPTLLGLQPPAMPQAAPQPDAPAPAQLPSLTRSPPPAMSPAGGNNGNPPGIPPTARLVSDISPTVPPGSDDDEDGPNPNLPAARAVPPPPARPQELGSGVTVSPTETGAIASGPPAFTGPASSASKPNGPLASTPQADSGGFDLGGALKRFSDSGGGDYLMALGGGLLSGKNFAEGLGAGFSAAGRVGAQQQASRLADAELQLKAQKAQQERGALNANATLIKQAFPALSDQQAIGGAGNTTLVSAAIARMQNPNAGRDVRQDASGIARYADTGQKVFGDDEAKTEFVQASTPGGGTLLYDKNDPTKGQVQLVPDQGVAPLTDPTARLKAGIRQDDKRAAWQKPDGTVTFEPQAPSTTINMPPTEMSRDKKIGDAIGTDISDYISAARPARDKLAALNVLSDAWKAGGDKITTGPAAERVLGLKQFARGSLGLNIGDDIAPSELISKIGTQLATADAKSLTARPTQFDFATYLKNNPGLTLTPEGNAALIDIKRQQAQHELDLAALARKKENWDNFDDVVAQYDRTHPIVSSLTGKPLEAGSVQFPGPASRQSAPVTGAAVPSGAVQALQQDPGLAAQFDAKYGAGASSRILGGR